MLLGQGTIRTLLLVVGICQMEHVSFNRPFQKLFALMGHMRPTTKADPCLHILKKTLMEMSLYGRSFAPNERSWLFPWLFQEALPLLLGVQTLQLVKLVMTDGDSKVMSQVDYAIATYFVYAFCSCCG
jgi:hypothetical protein